MKLYYGDIREIKDSQIKTYASLLPISMRQYVQRFFSNEDKKHKLLARLMIRHCLIQTIGNDSLLYDWRLNDKGKPFIDRWFNFNLSHSGDFVVLGYDVGSLGIDIEKIDTIDYLSVADYFHLEERAFIENSKCRKVDFYNIWVKKESALKAIGVGIIDGINKFSCVNNDFFYKNHLWHFYPISISPSYICYVCTRQLNQGVTIEKFNIMHIY